jgi:hypothetical protein
VNLPQVFESWSGVKHLHHFRLPTFAGAVVHDGDPRFERVNQDVAVRAGLPVMRHHEEVHGANGIGRTHQLEFLVDRQVAEIESAKLSKCQMDADGLGILGLINRTTVESFAIRVGRAGSCQRRADCAAA